MTITEARAFITWFRNNHLPKDAYFVRLNTGREILLDSMNDDDTLFVANQFEAMFDAATKRA